VRIYLPATLDEIAPGTTGLEARRAHAVTGALRAALPDEDDEGLEYAAQLAAADDSLERLRRSPSAPRLRVVVSVDVPEAVVVAVSDPQASPSTVEMVSGVGLVDVVAVHVDEPETAADVAAALAGDPEAVERVEEADLLWYDVTELGHIPR